MTSLLLPTIEFFSQRFFSLNDRLSSDFEGPVLFMQPLTIVFIHVDHLRPWPTVSYFPLRIPKKKNSSKIRI